MKSTPRLIPLCLIVLLIMSAFVYAGPELRIEKKPRTQVTVYQDQKEVAIHHSGLALDKPYIHPLWTPDDCIVTFDAPADHVHHRGLSIGWADISNTDFWAEVYSPQGRRGRIVTTELEQTTEEDGSVKLIEQNVWLKEDQTCLLSSQHTWTFYPAQGNLQIVDVELLFTAQQPEVVFGSDPNQPRAYHGLCFRIGPFENPRYFNSAGDEGGANCMGKSAKWCALSGIQRGKPVVTAILDSPNNSSFPTRFAVYHEGMQFISSSPNMSEPKVLKDGETWLLQYRVIAAGVPENEKGWNLDALWQEYADSVKSQN